jgi:hypothetical protein
VVARRFLTLQGEFRDVARWVNLPPTFVILQRINLGLYAILGRLHATANWRTIAEEIWPMTNGPASSALGEEEALWLAGTARD